MLPQLNLQIREDEMRPNPQTVAQGTSKDMSVNNLSDSDNTAKMPVRFVPEGPYEGTRNGTLNHIGAKGVHENGDVPIHSFQAETSHQSCFELTSHSLKVIKKR